MVDVPFFIAEWIPQAKYTENVNGGSLAWNPPFFAGCYFTAPFFVVGRPLGCSHAYDCIRLVFEILNCDLLVRTLRRIMTVNKIFT